jgi:beta-glucosidase
VPIARGASWDDELERSIGAAMAREASAQGANALGSTCINLIRHPLWGRSQETYGADTALLSRMGVALMQGIQSEGVIAVIKHFACNSVENSRFTVNVDIDERALHEVYLPHFKACADAGAAAFMAAYNRVNGRHCGHNRSLLQGILKDRWKFAGFVMSDFLLGIHGTAGALNAGLDVEMPQTFWFSRRRIKREIRAGRLDESRIRDAAGRVLSQLQRFGHVHAASTRPDAAVVGCSEHQRLALESARRSVVLLKNRAGVLPLGRVDRLAVIGPFIKRIPLGSEGSASVRPPATTDLLQGLKMTFPGTDICTCSGRDVDRAARLARSCDAAIITAGLRGSDEGEYFPLLGGGDRQQLELKRRHIELISAVAPVCPRSVVVLFGGSAIACGDWTLSPDSIIMAWYPGMHGGQALAEIISGHVNPSGRLPLTFPLKTSDLPEFDPKAERIVYDLYHDYRWMDKKGVAPAFPFGFGLSYTTFTYNAVRLEPIDTSRQNPHIRVTAEIENRGNRDGDEVVQLYVSRPEPGGVEHPFRELKAFRRLSVGAGNRVEASFDLDFHALNWFDPTKDLWVVEAGMYTVRIGPNALEQPLVAEFSIRA